MSNDEQQSKWKRLTVKERIKYLQKQSLPLNMWREVGRQNGVAEYSNLSISNIIQAISTKRDLPIINPHEMMSGIEQSLQNEQSRIQPRYLSLEDDVETVPDSVLSAVPVIDHTESSRECPCGARRGMNRRQKLDFARKTVMSICSVLQNDYNQILVRAQEAQPITTVDAVSENARFGDSLQRLEHILRENPRLLNTSYPLRLIEDKKDRDKQARNFMESLSTGFIKAGLRCNMIGYLGMAYPFTVNTKRGSGATKHCITPMLSVLDQETAEVTLPNHFMDVVAKLNLNKIFILGHRDLLMAKLNLRNLLHAVTNDSDVKKVADDIFAAINESSSNGVSRPLNLRAEIERIQKELESRKDVVLIDEAIAKTQKRWDSVNVTDAASDVEMQSI